MSIIQLYIFILKTSLQIIHYIGNKQDGMGLRVQWYGPKSAMVWAYECNGMGLIVQWYGPKSAMVWA
jgi:hypothetical protein